MQASGELRGLKAQVGGLKKDARFLELLVQAIGAVVLKAGHQKGRQGKQACRFKAPLRLFFQKELQDGALLPAEKRARIEQELATKLEGREGALDAIREEHAQTDAICAELEPLAEVKF